MYTEMVRSIQISSFVATISSKIRHVYTTRASRTMTARHGKLIIYVMCNACRDGLPTSSDTTYTFGGHIYMFMSNCYEWIYYPLMLGVTFTFKLPCKMYNNNNNFFIHSYIKNYNHNIYTYLHYYEYRLSIITIRAKKTRKSA